MKRVFNLLDRKTIDEESSPGGLIHEETYQPAIEISQSPIHRDLYILKKKKRFFFHSFGLSADFGAS